MIETFFAIVGQLFIRACKRLGTFGLFAGESLVVLCTYPLKLRKVVYQMNHIGVNSLGVVLLTGGAAGAVLALESHRGLQQFGAQHFIGPLVFLSMTREFGPVLSAIMVAGRAGSAMTAEIGTMRITEQLDALKTLCINVYHYLIVPRIIATTLVLPLLSLFCSLCGVTTGYFMAVGVLHVNSDMYLTAIREVAIMKDITQGIIKAVIFGFLLSIISCYKGFTTSGGAKGVGISTTQAVVYANVTIFLADYILSSLLKIVWPT